MRRRLPPLNAVRAFEAAARHLSFVAAADELAVTPSAISQQVKQLEEWLGRPLFRRLPRGLVPTETAKAYLPPLTEALDRIDVATTRVRGGKQARVLTVTCLSSFGAQWLTPRLHRFTGRHPDIDIMLATFDRLVDLETEEVDIAIRYGTGIYPGLHVEELMREMIGPVCSPDLAEHPDHPIRAIGDLAHHPLLHDTDAVADGPLNWEVFLGRVGAVVGTGPGEINAERGPRFSDSHIMIQSCLAGRGVMLGRTGLVADALDAGILVAPFGLTVPSVATYRLVMLPGAMANPKVAAFRAWLYEELGRAPPSG
jgi:LysR family glycine cleavage system transcriptional activator